MSLFRLFLAHGRVLAVLAGFFATHVALGQFYNASPIPSDSYTAYPYRFTGLMVNSKYTGSGAVVKSPRVVFSCAHFVFDATAVDPWITGSRWHNAWSSGSFPATGSGQLLRGYYYMAGYAAEALISNRTIEAYSLDFVVHYAYEDTAKGGFAGIWPIDDAMSALTSQQPKLVTGYPAGLYPVGDSRRYLMHSTGPFTRAFSQGSFSNLLIPRVTAGPGNSGGPVWVSDGTQYYYCGVVVAGSQIQTGDTLDRLGVTGLYAGNTKLIDDAIVSSGSVATPVITAQPTSRRVNEGDSASFIVAATGTELSYRWLFNGVVLPGATTASLTLNTVTPSHAGVYQVIVGNAGGDTPSMKVTLTVDPLLPAITVHPTTQSVGIGGTGALQVSAQSSTTVSFQWYKDGVAINGATSSSLSISNVLPSNAGSYTVKITNIHGSVTSNAAVLTVVTDARLYAISCRAHVGVGGDILIPGIVIGGSGSRQMIVRASGPAIAGVSGTLARPQLKLYQVGNPDPIASNTGWSNGTAQETAALQAAFAAANLPQYPMGSADCALLATVIAGNAYTATISGVGDSTGVALVEVYETGSGSARMTALSCRAQVGTGGNVLIPGIIVLGTTQKQVIIRAKGPGIEGVAGVLAQPTLSLFRGSTTIAQNTGWSTAANATAIASSTVAVGLAPFKPGSGDCAILTTLAPGGYTAHVSGLNGTTGVALIEVYEVP